MSVIKKLIPLPVKKKIRKRQKGIALWIKGITTKSLSAAQMVMQLNDLGIEGGAQVLVHSSLKSLGYVENGAATVIEAFKQAVGPEGLLCMPALSRSKEGGVGGVKSVATMDIFDLQNTPSGVGIISEVFRKQDQVIRSIHPTHSICSFGPNAKEFTAEHHNCKYPFGKKSPWQKMSENRFVFVMLGASVDSLTFAHVIEDNYDDWPLEVYDEREYVVSCKDNDGKLIDVSCWVHKESLAKVRHVTRLMGYFDALSGTRRGPVGEAEVLVMNSDEVYEAFKQALSDGLTIYGNLDNLKMFWKGGRCK